MKRMVEKDLTLNLIERETRNPQWQKARDEK
jgi:hypothetical protein